jgi:hypothetical protein
MGVMEGIDLDIRIVQDEGCEMFRIEFEGKCLFEGNNWDFALWDLIRLFPKLGFNVVEDTYTFTN